LKLLLSQRLAQSQTSLFGFVRYVDQAETAKECLERLETETGVSVDYLRSDEFGQRLESGNTLMDRHLLMLYWLLRKKGTRDFSYENLSERTRLRNEGRGWPSDPGKELFLEEGVRPEKQHIVPCSWLATLYNIEKLAGQKHEANNIGNLTFISEKLNSYETGLGDEAIDLQKEPPDNLNHHFLGKGVGEAYDRAKQSVSNVKKNVQSTPIERQEAKGAFKNFGAERRKLIQQVFANWLDELGRETVPDGIEPEKRPFAPSLREAVSAEVRFRLDREDRWCERSKET